MDRTCSYCGALRPNDDAPGGTPADWSFSVEDGRVKWLCGDCARVNIRAIEGKLPEEYWQ